MSQIVRRTSWRPALVAATVAALLVAAGILAPVTADAAGSGSGPRLLTPVKTLDRALKCSSDLSNAKKAPVLLVPGTGGTPEEDYGWNMSVLLPQQGHPVCELTVADNSLGDVQTNVEYVVRALRTMSAASGRKVSAIGHSQGALLITYALRIWPDLVRKVDDVIGYAGSYTYGSDLASALCLAQRVPCPPAFHQFVPGSHLLTALAKHPLPAGPSYTAYSSRYDEVVAPQPTASHLAAPGARNYVVQDVCPLDTPDHVLIIAEQPLLQLTLDALSHRGPASVERVAKVTCGFNKVLVRGVLPLTEFGVNLPPKYLALSTPAEPALRSYFHGG